VEVKHYLYIFIIFRQHSLSIFVHKFTQIKEGEVVWQMNGI